MLFITPAAVQQYSAEVSSTAVAVAATVMLLAVAVAVY